jgi:hypothetical protein
MLNKAHGYFILFFNCFGCCCIDDNLGGDNFHSVYSDGTLVVNGQQPQRLGEAIADPEANGSAHTQLRWDVNNSRIYQAREFGNNGKPIRDIDFTSPTFKNGVYGQGTLHLINILGLKIWQVAA